MTNSTRIQNNNNLYVGTSSKDGAKVKESNINDINQEGLAPSIPRVPNAAKSPNDKVSYELLSDEQKVVDAIQTLISKYEGAKLQSVKKSIENNINAVLSQVTQDPNLQKEAEAHIKAVLNDAMDQANDNNNMGGSEHDDKLHNFFLILFSFLKKNVDANNNQMMGAFSHMQAQEKNFSSTEKTLVETQSNTQSKISDSHNIKNIILGVVLGILALVAAVFTAGGGAALLGVGGAAAAATATSTGVATATAAAEAAGITVTATATASATAAATAATTAAVAAGVTAPATLATIATAAAEASFAGASVAATAEVVTMVALDAGVSASAAGAAGAAAGASVGGASASAAVAAGATAAAEVTAEGATTASEVTNIATEVSTETAKETAASATKAASRAGSFLGRRLNNIIDLKNGCTWKNLVSSFGETKGAILGKGFGIAGVLVGAGTATGMGTTMTDNTNVSQALQNQQSISAIYTNVSDQTQILLQQDSQQGIQNPTSNNQNDATVAQQTIQLMSQVDRISAA